MEVRIRFSLSGVKHQRSFKLVAIPARRKRDSQKKLDYLGFYNPRTKETKLLEEKIKMWIGRGAQLSKRVRELILRTKKDLLFQGSVSKTVNNNNEFKTGEDEKVS